MFLSNYHYILSNYTLALYIGRYFALSTWVLFNSVIQLINGVQFLNITPLFLSPDCLALPLSHVPVIFILPLTNICIYIYASL